jgi:hypothetical protein
MQFRRSWASCFALGNPRYRADRAMHTLTNPLAIGSYPSADTPLVVRVPRAELALQVAFLTHDDTAVDDRDRDRQRDERPGRIRDERDPGIRERHAEVTGIPSQPVRAIGNDRLRRRVWVNGCPGAAEGPHKSPHQPGARDDQPGSDRPGNA